MKWTSVKDSLPDRDAPYIVFIPTADDAKPLILIAWYDPNYHGYNEHGWTGTYGHWIDAITHWMELPGWPEDYKKEVDNEKV